MFHPSFYTLSPIIGVCLIIWFSNKDELITKILSTKLFVGIGLISYSLYLWHYPIFAFTRISLGFKTFNNYSFYFILLNFILSILTYFIIEKKFRDIFYFKFKYILVLIFLSYIILGMISLLGFKGFLFTDKQKAFLNLRIGNSLPINNFDTNDKIILIGDSHAESIFFDLNKKLKNISHFTNYYYQDLFFIDPKTKKNLDQFNILKKTKKINDFIKKKKNKELILILFLRPSYLYHNSFFINDLGDKESEYRFNYNRKPEVILQNIEDIILDDNSRKEIIKLSLKKTINIMLENNHKVILVYPMPEVGFHVPKKFIKKNFFSLEIMSTSYDFYVKRNEWLFNIYDEYNHKNIYRVYPHKLFCSTVIEQRCIVNTKNKLFYRDTDHPSEEGAKMINNLILKEIEKIELKYN